MARLLPPPAATQEADGGASGAWSSGRVDAPTPRGSAVRPSVTAPAAWQAARRGPVAAAASSSSRGCLALGEAKAEAWLAERTAPHPSPSSGHRRDTIQLAFTSHRRSILCGCGGSNQRPRRPLTTSDLGFSSSAGGSRTDDDRRRRASALPAAAAGPQHNRGGPKARSRLEAAPLPFAIPPAAAPPPDLDTTVGGAPSSPLLHWQWRI
jgi:CDGSH-type Zn-finger protein